MVTRALVLAAGKGVSIGDPETPNCLAVVGRCTLLERTLSLLDALGVGRTYAGYLISYPSVGRGMVIFRDPNGHRMVTTPVRRVLGDAGGDQIYVETENSVYLLTFRAEPLRQMPHALAAVTGSRQRKS